MGWGQSASNSNDVVLSWGKVGSIRYQHTQFGSASDVAGASSHVRTKAGKAKQQHLTLHAFISITRGARGRITCKPNRNSIGTCFEWGSRTGGSIKSFQEPLCCIIGPPSIWSGRPKGGQIGRTLPVRLRRAPAQHETVKLWGRHVIC